MDLFNKLLGKNDKETQLQNEIKSLQIRKESVLSVIKNEIGQLRKEKENVLLDAGTRGYANWRAGVNAAEGLEEFWNKIEEIEKNIVEKEEKRASMEARYDEEISLLQSDLYSAVPSVGGDVCPKCGAAVSSGDAFCEKCGNKLK